LSNFASLTHMRIRLALRNKMFFFFAVVMPFIFFFGYLGFFGKSVPAGAAYFLGPVLALNVMGSLGTQRHDCDVSRTGHSPAFSRFSHRGKRLACLERGG